MYTNILLLSNPFDLPCCLSYFHQIYLTKLSGYTWIGIENLLLACSGGHMRCQRSKLGLSHGKQTPYTLTIAMTPIPLDFDQAFPPLQSPFLRILRSHMRWLHSESKSLYPYKNNKKEKKRKKRKSLHPRIFYKGNYPLHIWDDKQ